MTTFVKPDNPGVDIRFVGESLVRVPPSFAATVAIPFVHDWGPLGSDDGGSDLVASFAEFEARYGTGATAGRTAVLGGFQGSGILVTEGGAAVGAGGAGGVIPYRMATGAAAAAAHTFQNTAPANAITLTAKYKGTRGNDLSVVIEDDPTDAARDQLRVLFRGVDQERYRYAATDITALVAAVNVRSKWVKAVQVATGVALTATTGTALTGGDNGASLASAQWLAALDALEFQPFGIFAPYDLVDAGIRASLLSWVQTQAAEMRPVRAVVGGAAAETPDDAIARSALLADEHFVNVGVGTWHDDVLDADLSTSQLAPRLAGVLAARGEGRSLTYAPLAGLSPVGDTGPSTDELKALADGGVTAFRRTSDPDTDLIVARGVTTFTDQADPAKPYGVFSEPRMVGIMDDYIRNMKAWGGKNIIGGVTVSDDSRSAVYGQGRKLQTELEDANLIVPGTGFVDVTPPDDPDLADAIPYSFGWRFARTADFVLGQGRIR